MADLIPIPDDSGLTRSILARTSGAPCERLRSLACDFVDGALESDSVLLAQAHLDHCADCSALVSVLRASTASLPAMAEADPGPWFPEQVMRATAWAPRPAADPRSWWIRLMRRPRIALEAAYLGAMAGFVGFSLPAPSLVKSLRAPAIIRPLSVSKENLIRAERRTVQAVAGIFMTPEGRAPRAIQRWLAKVRAWFNPGEPSSAPTRPSP